MTAIDILQNPSTNKAPQNNERPSLLSRALQSGARGSVFLPDMVSNASKRMGDKLADMMGATTPSGNLNLNENEKNLIDSGIINPNMPPPQTYGEKFADYAGSGAGSLLPFLPLKGGVSSLFGTIPKAASTVGMVAAPAAIGPKVDEWSGNNPLVSIPTQIMASILGGKTSGGIANLFSPKTPLPEFTAAQSVPTSSPRYDKLISRQENLMNTDKKSAEIGKQMLQNQQQKLGDMLQNTEKTSGDEVASQIEDVFSKKIAERAKNYEDASNDLFADQSRPINTDNTISALGKAQQEAPKLGDGRTTPLEKAINDSFDLITNNSHNPILLKGALSEIQHMANPAGPMQLSSQQSAVLRPVIDALRTDIESAYPGFKDLNTQWANDTENLQTLREGVVGKIDKKADLNPEQVFQNMFEKTDPSRIGQVKDVLGPDLYGKAANTYLQGVGNKQLIPSSDSISNNNPSPEITSLSNYLRKRQGTLAQTLPQDQNSLTQDLIDRSTRATRGIPDKNFGKRAQDTANNPLSAIADYNNKNLLPYVADIVKNTGGKQIINSLQRNEMLTGQTPSAQMMGGIVPPSVAVGAMNQPPLHPTNQPKVAPQNQPIANEGPLLPPSSMQSQQAAHQNMGTSAINDLLKQYGSDNGKNQIQQGQSPSAIDALVKQYGLNNSTQIPTSPSKSNIPLPDKVLDYVSKELKKGNTDVLYDPHSSYEKYNSSMAPDSPAFMDKVKKIIASRESSGSGDYSAMSPNSSALGKYQFIDETRNRVMPGVSREDFLNNPDLQEEAMNKLIMANEQTFKNKGIDINSVPPDHLAGMITAAHLRGPQAGINAYQNSTYQGDPDANGTLPRNYYDYAKNSFNSGKFDPTPDFKSMGTDDLLNYGKKFLPDIQQPDDLNM